MKFIDDLLDKKRLFDEVTKLREENASLKGQVKEIAFLKFEIGGLKKEKLEIESEIQRTAGYVDPKTYEMGTRVIDMRITQERKVNAALRVENNQLLNEIQPVRQFVQLLKQIQKIPAYSAATEEERRKERDDIVSGIK